MMSFFSVIVFFASSTIGKAFKATDAETYACTLSHTVETQDTTYAALAASTQGSPETRTLSVVSSGCGLGEYFGDFARGADGTKCVVSREIAVGVWSGETSPPPGG